MMTASFNDGTACRIDTVHGAGFAPRPGDVLLFEFPDGTLKEGYIHVEDPLEAHLEIAPFNGSYNREANTVTLTH
jgi:hypothetical protein